MEEHKEEKTKEGTKQKIKAKKQTKQKEATKEEKKELWQEGQEISNETTRTTEQVEKESISTKERMEEVSSKPETEKMQEELLEKSIKHRQIRIKGMIIGTIIVVVLGMLSTIFALVNINNTKIMKGVYIQDIEVSNLSQEEAREAIQNVVEETLNKNIMLTYQGYEKILVPKDIETNYDIGMSLSKAYQIGRGGNIFQNNYEILKAFLFKEKIELPMQINEEKLDEFIQDMELNIPDAVVQSSYTIDGENLIITKGVEGSTVKKEELKQQIMEDLQTNLNQRDQVIEIPLEQTKPEEINIEKIHEEIYKEPQNAYFVKEPFQLFTHVDGVDFAISIDEAKELLKEDKQEYTIPLKITPPEITTQKLGAEAFPEKLSTFTTRYDASNRNRATNISIATGTLNGTVLMPGETLSFNSTLGPRTPAKGYKEAGAYLDGQVIESYGGGICQVSSTLYNTVLLANLEVVTRYNHSSLVSYLDPSRDAAVSYGGKDFVFKNSRTYPIKISASAKNGILKIEIYGIREEVEYEVVIESKVTKSIPYSIKYVDNPTLAKGSEVIQTKGTNGAKSVAYKVLKLNGAIVSRTELSQDTYNPMQRVIQRGTADVPVTEGQTQSSAEIIDEPVQ